jgi:hypothetical protein
MHSREERSLEASVARVVPRERDSTILNYRHGSVESLGSAESFLLASPEFTEIESPTIGDARTIWLSSRDETTHLPRRIIARESTINSIIRWLNRRYDEEENNDDVTSALFLRFIIVSSLFAAGCALRSPELVNSHRAFRSRAADVRIHLQFAQ